MKANIDGKCVEASVGTTILQGARECGIHIPTLCHLKDLNCISACRVCMVRADGKLVPACSTLLRDGMEIVTQGEDIRRARRRNLELICSDHHMDCSDCPRGVDCELRQLCQEYGVDDRAFGIGTRRRIVDDSTPWLVRDNAKCILCRRCQAVCSQTQGIGAIAVNRKGGETTVGFGLPLSETQCVGCGQCAAVCPTGALTPKDDTKKAWKAIFDKDTFVAAVISSSAAHRIGELFGEASGTCCANKLAEILRKIGFDAVFDLTETEEYRKKLLPIKAVQQGKSVSADCPAWRRYMEQFHPELADELICSDSLVPLLTEGCAPAAQGKKLFFVNITNCISGKPASFAHVALSTRETFEMIRRACVSGFTANQVWQRLTGAEFDRLPPLPPIPEAKIRIRTVSGLKNAEKALAQRGAFDFLMVQACPGGCMNGGGMPRVNEIETEIG